MKFKINIYILLLFISVLAVTAKAQPKNYVRMVESEMKRNPRAWMLDFSKELKWNYGHGLELQAILQVWKATGQIKYYTYAYDYVDLMVKHEGDIKYYKLSEYNLDKVNTGKILFPIYEKTKEERFRVAINLLRDQMLTQPRTRDGSFWYKVIYPHQIWLEGAYMACPFLAQYAQKYKDEVLFNDVAQQILDMHKHTYDSKTGLYYHGWDESFQEKWANPETGLSPNFWSRSIGWYAMAIVDVLDFLPESHPKRSEIINILQNLCLSLDKFRDKKTGMWYQVTDKLKQKGNYLESSGSIMFIYTWIKGAQKGYLDKSFDKKGRKAYDQFVKRFIRKEDKGVISVTDCCEVAGLGGIKKYRDGSFEYYVSESVRDNDPKTVGPFIMTSILLDK